MVSYGETHGSDFAFTHYTAVAAPCHVDTLPYMEGHLNEWAVMVKFKHRACFHPHTKWLCVVISFKYYTCSSFYRHRGVTVKLRLRWIKPSWRLYVKVPLLMDECLEDNTQLNISIITDSLIYWPSTVWQGGVCCQVMCQKVLVSRKLPLYHITRSFI